VKNRCVTWFMCCFLMIIIPVCAEAYVVLKQPAITTLSIRKEERKVTLKDFVNSSKKDLKAKLGRRLTLKEQISFLLLKKILKNAVDKNAALGEVAVNDRFQICANIVFQNGDIIEVDIIELTSTEIKYRRCGKPNDPEFVADKKEVLSVRATNGQIVFRNTEQNVRSAGKHDKRRIETNAIIALAGSILFFPLGIIFGIISLNKISKHPEKYKGKGLAVAGIVIGGIHLLYLLLVLFLLYSLLFAFA